MSGDLALPAWTLSALPVPYLEAVQRMEERVEAIRRGEAAEQVWLLEHSPLYTGCPEGNACKFFQAKKPEPETAEAYKMADQKLRCKSG